jgi:hypothetical protein
MANGIALGIVTAGLAIVLSSRMSRAIVKEAFLHPLRRARIKVTKDDIHVEPLDSPGSRKRHIEAIHN